MNKLTDNGCRNTTFKHNTFSTTRSFVWQMMMIDGESWQSTVCTNQCTFRSSARTWCWCTDYCVFSNISTFHIDITHVYKSLSVHKQHK